LLERDAACLSGPLQDVLKPDIQRVRTHWNRGFMAFQLRWNRDLWSLQSARSAAVPGVRLGAAWRERERPRGRGLARAGADGQGELWMWLEWPAARMERCGCGAWPAV
jgi:hypothetical protein